MTLHRRGRIAPADPRRRSSPRSPPRPDRARRDPRRRPAQSRPPWKTARGTGTSDVPAHRRQRRAVLLRGPRLAGDRSTTASPPWSAGCCTTRKAILADQLEQSPARPPTRGFAHGDFDFALLTDGLRAEREQGITIDVAYRYFSTAHAVVHPRRLPRRTCSTPATRSPARPPPTRSSCWSTRATAYSSRPGGTLAVRRLLARAARHRRGQQDRPGRLPRRMPSPASGEGPRRRRRARHRPTSTRSRSRRSSGDNVVDRAGRTPWYDGPGAARAARDAAVAADALDRSSSRLRLPVQLVLRPQGGSLPRHDAAEAGAASRLPRGRGPHRQRHRARRRPGRGRSRRPRDHRDRHPRRRHGGRSRQSVPQSVSLPPGRRHSTPPAAPRGGGRRAPAAPTRARRRAVPARRADADPGTRVLIRPGTATVQAIVARDRVAL